MWQDSQRGLAYSVQWGYSLVSNVIYRIKSVEKCTALQVQSTAKQLAPAYLYICLYRKVGLVEYGLEVQYIDCGALQQVQLATCRHCRINLFTKLSTQSIIEL